jgi:hypothetical protein
VRLHVGWEKYKRRGFELNREWAGGPPALHYPVTTCFGIDSFGIHYPW